VNKCTKIFLAISRVNIESKTNISEPALPPSSGRY